MLQRIKHNDGKYIAVVLAGDRGGFNAVAKAAGVRSKALVDVGGIPMLVRVVQALSTSTMVERTILSGPQWEAVHSIRRLRDGVKSGKYEWHQNLATPVASAVSVFKVIKKDRPVLLTTADHALLSGDIVDFFCCQSDLIECDLALALARRENVMQHFTDAKRTVFKFRDGDYCTCNLFAFKTSQSRTAVHQWRHMQHRRKKTWRVIQSVGWRSLLKYKFGKLSLDDALQALSQRMGLRIRAVIMPHPEAAIDVDTVNDWEMVRSRV